MTLGSLVLILLNNGTNFSVNVYLSSILIIEWKQIRVLHPTHISYCLKKGEREGVRDAYLTLTDNKVVLLNTVVILGNNVCFTVYTRIISLLISISFEE